MLGRPYVKRALSCLSSKQLSGLSSGGVAERTAGAWRGSGSDGELTSYSAQERRQNKMRKLTLPIIAFLVTATLFLSSTPALAAFGSQLGVCTVASGNGRAVAFDPASNRVFSTHSSSTTIFVTGPAPGCASMPSIATSPGVVCGALSWDPFRAALWCGAYDGSGRVWLVDDDTGTALLQFTYPADQSCYGTLADGHTDGLALDANGTALLTDDTIWASGDAATKIY